MINDDYSVNESPSHIVAIGASAGGLEALEILFDALPVKNYNPVMKS